MVVHHIRTTPDAFRTYSTIISCDLSPILDDFWSILDENLSENHLKTSEIHPKSWKFYEIHENFYENGPPKWTVLVQKKSMYFSISGEIENRAEKINYEA